MLIIVQFPWELWRENMLGPTVATVKRAMTLLIRVLRVFRPDDDASLSSAMPRIN